MQFGWVSYTIPDRGFEGDGIRANNIMRLPYEDIGRFSVIPPMSNSVTSHWGN